MNQWSIMQHLVTTNHIHIWPMIVDLIQPTPQYKAQKLDKETK